MRELTLVFFFSLCLFEPAFCGVVFKQCNQGLKDTDISALVVSPDNPNLAYIGSKKAIYRTQDGAKTWETVLSLKGIDKRANFLAFNREDTNIIYAATGNGLLKIKAFSSNTWEKLFSGVGENEKNCTCILAESERIFLGTGGGLFISSDSGRNWRKAGGELGNSIIVSIATSKKQLFVATPDVVFISLDKGENFSKGFNLGLRGGAAENSEGEDILEPEENLEAESAGINFLFVDKEDKLYLAAGRRILASFDSGVSFQAVSSSGLSGARIGNVASLEGNLYASTQKGLFVLAKDARVWQNYYAGLLGIDTRFIGFDSLKRLWVVTDKGVFRSLEGYAYNQTLPDKASDCLVRFKDEPTISEVQNAAIKYAEVIDPQKIENLRKGARLKALVPSFDLDYNKTVDYDSGSDKYFIGPREWSVGFSWDLGDLVWSDQQRLIDSQVRLMIELRDDILNEVTRLYYERRRLQAEIFLSPPDEPKIKIEKELRLQELTASIDGLTGGYLSGQSGLRN